MIDRTSYKRRKLKCIAEIFLGLAGFQGKEGEKITTRNASPCVMARVFGCRPINTRKNLVKGEGKKTKNTTQVSAAICHYNDKETLLSGRRRTLPTQIYRGHRLDTSGYKMNQILDISEHCKSFSFFQKGARPSRLLKSHINTNIKS